MSGKSPYELETLFIDKLTEKYKLTERDIKKAFAQYDRDGNGLLDLSEITGAIQLYLNGISRPEIQQFVKHYDTNGDGYISFEEFFSFLTKRNAVPKTAARTSRQPVIDDPPPAPSADHRRKKEPEKPRRSHRDKESERPREKWDFNPEAAAPKAVGVVNAWDHTAYGERPTGRSSGSSQQRRPSSTAPSDASRFDPSDEHSVIIRARRFVQNVRALETKRAMAVRMQDKSYDKHSVQLSEILDKISRAHIVQSLDRYLHDDEESRTSGVKYRDFCRVMRQYHFPGVEDVRDEALLYIYQLVCVRGGASFSNIQMALMDPLIFATLLFPPRKARGSADSNKLKWAHSITSVPDGVFDQGDAVTGEAHGSGALVGAVEHMDLEASVGANQQTGERRKSMARGPIRNQNDSGLPLNLEPSDLPSKFQSRKVHNTLKAPYDFEPATVTNSGQLPAASLSFDYVFGLRTDFHSGHAIYGTQLQNTRARLEGKSDPFVAVYATAAVGVVHRLDSNTQTYFNEHSDDISCIALSPDGSYAATGQIGKYPECYIWSINDPSSGPIARIGSKKFFSRAVCTVCFSYDAEYIMAMSCDDRHSMGIFKISSGLLVAETVAGNGVPPQIRSSTWCAVPQATAFISASHASGKNDLFVTAGERTLKLWSFCRPRRLGGSAEEPASILCCNAIMGRGAKGGKFPVDHAPIYYCTAFIRQPDEGAGGSMNKNDDLVSGGSNGYVYLWHGKECANVLKASSSPIRAMQVVGVFLLVGCDSGVVKILQGNLVQVAAITVSHSSLFNEPSTRPRSASSGAATRAANRPAPGSARHLRPADRPASRGGNSNAPKKEKFSARELEALGDAATWSRLDVIGVAYLGHEDEGTRTMVPVSRSGDLLNGNAGASQGGTYMPRMFSGDLLVVTSSGQCFKIYAQPLAGGRPSTPQARRPIGSRELSASLSPELLFYFHVGPVWAAATKGDIIATGGDDKWICLWSMELHRLIGRFLSYGAIRCINFDHTGNALTIGLTSGVVSVFSVDYALASKLAHSDAHTNFPSLIRRIASRKDAAEEISDSKFNPTATMLAVGSHDNYIYLYDCGFSPASGIPSDCDLKLLRRLKGHSSYITHLDWSTDGRLIQSNCGAYEILYWDALSGRQFLFRAGENASNTKWKTETCVLGFSVMGIWPMYSDGTDINAVDVSKDHRLVVTAGDNGMVTLFNYPCVVKNPPCLEYKAHSSHVLCARFAKNDTRVVSVGGNDECVVLWKVRKAGGLK